MGLAVQAGLLTKGVTGLVVKVTHKLGAVDCGAGRQKAAGACM